MDNAPAIAPQCKGKDPVHAKDLRINVLTVVPLEEAGRPHIGACCRFHRRGMTGFCPRWTRTAPVNVDAEGVRRWREGRCF